MFHLQRGKPCLEHVLMERELGFERREIRLDAAKCGRRVVYGFGTRANEFFVGALMSVGETKVFRQSK
jgi:hypothetical protein